MIRAPFIGTKVIDSISLSEIESRVNRSVLYSARWQFGALAGSPENSAKADAIYARTLALCEAKSLVEPKVIYGHFECERSGNGIIVYCEDRPFRFDFPREGKSPNRCLADLFGYGFASFQIVTVGSKIDEEIARAFSEKIYSESFYLKGFCAEITEALADYCHDLVRKEAGAEGVGERFSPGYPAFPDLISQRKIFSLLKPIRIGIKLTKTCMMVPEHSTSAIISFDPTATRFIP